MNCLLLAGTDPAENLEMERSLFENAGDDPAVFMLWQNAPSVILGRHQIASQEIDEDYAREHGISVARRMTGGGAVYHDLGNLNYTVIMNREDCACRDGENLYHFFCRPMLEVLASYGVRASYNGRNDLEVDGRKFSGNAQFERDGRILHHGTLLYHTDLGVMDRVLTPDPEKFTGKGIRSVRSRVVNLKELLPERVTLEVLKAALWEAYRFLDAR